MDSRTIDLIKTETNKHFSIEEFLNEVEKITISRELKQELISKKLKFDNFKSYIYNEELWFKKYSWFMARVLMLAGIIVLIAAIFYVSIRNELIIILLGCAFYYLLLAIISPIRISKNKEKLKIIENNYKKDLQNLIYNY